MADKLIPELIRFGRDQIKALGKPMAGRYIAQCLSLWRERYGEKVHNQVRRELANGWRDDGQI